MKKFLIIFLCALPLAGCLKDNIPIEPNLPDGGRFTISLVNGNSDGIERSSGTTRAGTPGDVALNETAVKRIDIFFFDASGQCLVYPAQSDITHTGNKVTISMSKADAAKIFNRSITLYIVANSLLPRNNFEGKSYQEITNLSQTNNTLNPYPFVKQDSFLMDGRLAINNLTKNNSDLGSVTLRRAAAKITVSISDAKVTGYKAVEAFASLENYTDRTKVGTEAPYLTLSDSDFKNSGLMPVYIPNNGGTPYATNPLYSYANDWENGGKASYVNLLVKWQRLSDGTEKEYYYKIPFENIPPDAPDGKKFRLRRNYIYKFNVKISTLGGPDPGNTVILTPALELRDWTTDRIMAMLNQYDYLVVGERDIEIHDITTKLIRYTSSRPIDITVDSVFYRQLHTNGTVERKDYLPGNTKYPKITVDETAGMISVVSPVPENYVPVHIYFRVSNGTNIEYKVRVTQYPRQYFTYSYSDISYINSAKPWYQSKNPEWYDTQATFYWNNGNGYESASNPAENLKNFNFYTVTTTSVSPGDTFFVGGDLTRNITNAHYGDYIQTKSDAETNRMISPKFIIASHRGVVVPLTFGEAQRRCGVYSEGPYPRGAWRIPTSAEMEMIYRLQEDPNSALKNLFVPLVSGMLQTNWWVGRYEGSSGSHTMYSYNIQTGQLQQHGPTNNPDGTKVSVRCVHDIWKDQ